MELKNCQKMSKMSLKLFNLCLKKGIPDDWKVGSITMIPKKKHLNQKIQEITGL